MADVRRAVREALASLPPQAPDVAGSRTRSVPDATQSSAASVPDAAGSPQPAAAVDAPLLLVGLSGGPDSLGLALATAFEAPRNGFRAGAVIVDHALQPGSADAAAGAAATAARLGLDPVVVTRVTVDRASPLGPEGAARAARYSAFDEVRQQAVAAYILLGHTLDDQAETVLLGLARGSGPSSLSGMAALSGRYLRPLLGIRRRTVHESVADAGLIAWSDPQNIDPAYARVRVRETVLPLLEAELGPGVSEALARTAVQLREDDEALDALATEWAAEIVEHAEAGLAVDVHGLMANPAALAQRIVRFVVASEFGVSLSRAQTLSALRLATEWHGQSGVDLPGIHVTRAGRQLLFARR